MQPRFAGNAKLFSKCERANVEISQRSVEEVGGLFDEDQLWDSKQVARFVEKIDAKIRSENQRQEREQAARDGVAATDTDEGDCQEYTVGCPEQQHTGVKRERGCHRNRYWLFCKGH